MNRFSRHEILVDGERISSKKNGWYLGSQSHMICFRWKSRLRSHFQCPHGYDVSLLVIRAKIHMARKRPLLCLRASLSEVLMGNKNVMSNSSKGVEYRNGQAVSQPNQRLVDEMPNFLHFFPEYCSSRKFSVVHRRPYGRVNYGSLSNLSLRFFNRNSWTLVVTVSAKDLFGFQFKAVRSNTATRDRNSDETPLSRWRQWHCLRNTPDANQRCCDKIITLYCRLRALTVKDLH